MGTNDFKKSNYSTQIHAVTTCQNLLSLIVSDPNEAVHSVASEHYGLALINT